MPVHCLCASKHTSEDVDVEGASLFPSYSVMPAALGRECEKFRLQPWSAILPAVPILVHGRWCRKVEWCVCERDSNKMLYEIIDKLSWIINQFARGKRECFHAHKFVIWVHVWWGSDGTQTFTFLWGEFTNTFVGFLSGVRAEREREREIMKWFVCVLNLKFLSYKTFFISIGHINNCI